ncbi:hypothetical protein GEV33_004346 [Tenebrio molitor]|uniref:Uncharacterized protein n=1 Tax=Tenebrio molitor TaxID=7067 RepID=A0A8J6HPL1_TENMO|nr:hypothetical protein GEV33_004346 [Tenebrio molitor]
MGPTPTNPLSLLGTYHVSAISPYQGPTDDTQVFPIVPIRRRGRPRKRLDKSPSVHQSSAPVAPPPPAHASPPLELSPEHAIPADKNRTSRREKYKTMSSNPREAIFSAPAQLLPCEDDYLG